MRVATRVLLLTFLFALTAFPSETDRLVKLAEVWGSVKFSHPYLLYRDIDWDAALVAAIPRVRATESPDEFAAAVGSMLEALNDPATRVVRKRKPVETKKGEISITRWASPEILVIDIGPHADEKGTYDFWVVLRGASEEIAKAKYVIVDLRSTNEHDLMWATEMIPGLSDTPLQTPARRSVIHSGYRPQDGFSSGGYFIGFLTIPGETLAPAPKAPERIAFLARRDNAIAGAALALRAAGRALFVADAPLDDASAATTRPIQLGPDWEVRTRVDELETTGAVAADAIVAPVPGRDSLFEKAVEMLQQNVRPRIAEGRAQLPPPLWRRDRDHPEMEYPSLEYRILAAFRLWTVIDRFYPYKHLIGDWDAVLPEFLPRFIAAANAKEYLTTVLEMAARIEDTHTGVSGKSVREFFGTAWMPIEVREVEGEPVVTWVASAARDRIKVGDIIVSLDAEPFGERVARLRKYRAGSTEISRTYYAMYSALRGPTGSTATLELRGADGKLRRVELARVDAYPAPERDGPLFRVLESGVGYVDLTRLSVSDVDAMFDALGGTRTMILDMRGYPRGTAWEIAPRINTKGATRGASFRRRLNSSTSDEEADSGFYFEQPLPKGKDKPKYGGKTVMLIDERTISQAEHSGLFFEAANGTEFIGTNSAGANGDVTTLVLPGGLSVRFTGHDVRHADGRQLQRVGLEPHLRVAPTIEGIRAGRDEVLERAIEYLREKK